MDNGQPRAQRIDNSLLEAPCLPFKPQLCFLWTWQLQFVNKRQSCAINNDISSHNMFLNKALFHGLPAFHNLWTSDEIKLHTITNAQQHESIHSCNIPNFHHATAWTRRGRRSPNGTLSSRTYKVRTCQGCFGTQSPGRIIYQHFLQSTRSSRMLL
jgi:hypothetical protein